ncbi:MAG: tetratricopeptide repeat protein [Planctomycetota bacterium]|jgi:tetratricopeptide (TPR) repeat protein
MTRRVITVAVICLLALTMGCPPSDQGLSQRLPRRTTYVEAAPQEEAATVVNSADEIDLVEQMATHRVAYRRSLQLLTEHYRAGGDNKKLAWAEEELRALDRMPQYGYITAAEVLPADLEASTRVAAADELFADARETQRQAEPIGILKDQEGLRVALRKYNQLVQQYPNSDKIDDAAYQAAGIYEYFNDYETALLYYKRSYQWEPNTPHPARFRAASLLDKKLRRRDEALELYQEAVLREGPDFEEWRVYGEKRIRELSRSDDAGS